MYNRCNRTQVFCSYYKLLKLSCGDRCHVACIVAILMYRISIYKYVNFKRAHVCTYVTCSYIHGRNDVREFDRVST